MRSKSNTDGDEWTNDRKQEGPYKGVETQGKGRQSLTTRRKFLPFCINHNLTVLAIKHKSLECYCVSSRSVHSEPSSFITIETKFWTGSFYFIGNVPWRTLHHVWWTHAVVIASVWVRCVTVGLKSRSLSHCAYPWCSSASGWAPQNRPFRECLCKPG